MFIEGKGTYFFLKLTDFCKFYGTKIAKYTIKCNRFGNIGKKC